MAHTRFLSPFHLNLPKLRLKCSELKPLAYRHDSCRARGQHAASLVLLTLPFISHRCQLPTAPGLPQIETLARTYPGPVASAPLATLLNLEVTVTSRSGGAAGDNSPGAPSQSQSQAAAPSQSQPAFAVGSQAPGAAARTVAPKQLSKKDRESTLRDFWLDGWLAHAPSKPNHFCIGVSSDERAWVGRGQGDSAFSWTSGLMRAHFCIGVRVEGVGSSLRTARLRRSDAVTWAGGGGEVVNKQQRPVSAWVRQVSQIVWLPKSVTCYHCHNVTTWLAMA